MSEEFSSLTGRPLSITDLWNLFKSQSSDALTILEMALSGRLDLKAIIEEGDDHLLLQFFEDLLKTIPPRVLVFERQMLTLTLINTAPSRLTQWMLEHYLVEFTAEDAAKKEFQAKALAVIIAVARSLPETSEGSRSVAKFLSHFVELDELKVELNDQLATNDTEARFRVYSVAEFALELESPLFGAIQPLVEKLAEELDSSDVLECITALEMLSEMASKGRKAAECFHRLGLLDKTYEMLERTRDEPDSGLQHASCHRFFGYLASAVPGALQAYPGFTAEVFNMTYCFDALDIASRLLAFDSLAMISATSEAKALLTSREFPHNMNKAMNHFGVVIATGTEELRVRHLEALDLMMSRCESEVDSDILHGWWNELGEVSFPTLITRYLKQPIGTIRVQTLRLLRTLFSTHKWAPSQFIRVPGFIDALLDRKLQLDALEAQLKYDVVCALIANETDATLSVIELLRQYKAQGAFYSPAQVEVAHENL